MELSQVDIVMPSATQNDVNMDEAKKIVANGTQYYIEVANMPTTNDALKYLQENCKAVAPSKAVNAGGVAVSALEMSQNSIRYSWTSEEVDEKLDATVRDSRNSIIDGVVRNGHHEGVILVRLVLLTLCLKGDVVGRQGDPGGHDQPA